MNEDLGKVYLVGAGPGDVAYLTVQAMELLSQAEVLVYDALVDAQLLEQVPGDCLRMNVGKRGGQPSFKQGEINRLLVEQCRLGRRVVRLKSGDPFIFGRCMAELEALTAAGCAFEVIPGLSSALTAPLLAGIPLTDPVLSRCFAVFTAHDPEAIDWQTLTQIETLVILMGGQQLPEIVRQLRRGGRSPQTPIALIRWAGHPQQQIWTGTLTDILEKTAGNALSPAVIVIGEVVKLRKYLRNRTQAGKAVTHFPSDRDHPTHNQALSMAQEAVVSVQSEPDSSASLSAVPLTDKTILVTRSAGQSSQFSDRLRAAGAVVVEMPALEITPPSSWAALDQAIDQLESFDWLILTSSNGVAYFFERLGAQLQDINALAGIKIAAVGEKTAATLKRRGIKPDFIPPNFVADSLIANFPAPVVGQKILFPRVESGGREVLVKELTEAGAEVVEVAAYESRCPQTIAPEALAALQQHTIQVITFASAKTVKHFCQLVEQAMGTDWQSSLTDLCIASIGPQTSQACRSLLGRVDVEAQEYTLEGLTQAIVQWAKNTGS
ncbi:MAG: uroporphyrinogen-III C-methyltransferase [Scytolyngbya sp. HA4215-MV1]|nr:uroporphyrinogen-III C-methyltransferase [Scytolyngbya sp. HA4215-MV1]